MIKTLKKKKELLSYDKDPTKKKKLLGLKQQFVLIDFINKLFLLAQVKYLFMDDLYLSCNVYHCHCGPNVIAKLMPVQSMGLQWNIYFNAVVGHLESQLLYFNCSSFVIISQTMYNQ